jgi:hypothetical protein
MNYEDLPPIRVRTSTACLTGGSEQQAKRSFDWHFTTTSRGRRATCNRLLGANDIGVRRAALIALGHVARLHGHVGPETYWGELSSR